MIRSRMPTLLDVARAAGVSRSTVSNVFSSPEVVRPEVRERVAEVALKLGYLGPDPKGRMLRSGRVNAIGIVPPGNWGVADTLNNPVYLQVLLGIAEVCDGIGANVVLIPDKPGKTGVQNALVDGLIFGRIEHITEVERARLRRLPFVIIDYDAGPDMSSVRVDAHAGCYAAARHLIELGHRRFGIVSFLRDFGSPRFHPPGWPRGPEAAGMPIDREKLAGYAQALAEAGIAVDSIPMVQAHPWERNAAALMLDVAPDATAILSMSAMQGIAVMAEARRRGLTLPRDLSVVGFNDIPDAAKADPPLTTVDGMAIEKGRLAARIVLEAGAARRELVQSRLVIRASTSGPRR